MRDTKYRAFLFFISPVISLVLSMILNFAIWMRDIFEVLREWLITKHLFAYARSRQRINNFELLSTKISSDSNSTCLYVVVTHTHAIALSERQKIPRLYLFFFVFHNFWKMCRIHAARYFVRGNPLVATRSTLRYDSSDLSQTSDINLKPLTDWIYAPNCRRDKWKQLVS